MSFFPHVCIGHQVKGKRNLKAFVLTLIYSCKILMVLAPSVLL